MRIDLISQAASPSPHRGRAVLRLASWVLLAILLAAATAGCRTEATNQDYNYNNPLDPNQDDDDDDDDNTGQIVIFYVNSAEDHVILLNSGLEDTDMSSWSLENEDNSASYAFTGFTLEAGQAVRVHSGSGTDDADDLYAGTGTPNWSGTPPNHQAILRDGGGDIIDICEDGDECWP